LRNNEWDVFVDFLTSDTSVVPYDLSTLQSMLDLSINLVEYVQPLISSGDELVELPAHLMCVLGMIYAPHVAFFHLHTRSSPHAVVR